MPITAFVIFGLTLFGIIILFAIKIREMAYPSAVRAPWRDRADDFALQIKWVILVLEWYISRLPLLTTRIVRRIVGSAALSYARLARVSAEQAHLLADFVSHKRSFERRETKSQFLKQVIEHKNGNGGDDASQL